jgi:hypothetical protein
VALTELGSREAPMMARELGLNNRSRCLTLIVRKAPFTD